MSIDQIAASNAASNTTNSAGISVRLPKLAETTHLETQIFDNRKTAKPGFAKMKAKLSALNCPVDQVHRTLAAQAYSALHNGRNFRKQVTKRLKTGTMSAKRAEELIALSHSVPEGNLIGVVDGNDIAVVLEWDGVEVSSVTLHYPDGKIVHKGEEGTARRDGASQTSAIWRAYYDPHNYWDLHRGEVYKAHQRRRDHRVRDLAAQGAVEGVTKEFGETIELLTNKIVALNAENAVMNEKIAALLVRIEVLEGEKEMLAGYLIEQQGQIDRLIDEAKARFEGVERRVSEVEQQVIEQAMARRQSGPVHQNPVLQGVPAEEACAEKTSVQESTYQNTEECPLTWAERIRRAKETRDAILAARGITRVVHHEEHQEDDKDDQNNVYPHYRRA